MGTINRIAFAVALLVGLIALCGVLLASGAEMHNYKPVEGYVPDKATAIAIAIAVWGPIYGKENIEQKKPYKAVLQDGVWYVSGSLPLGWMGGVPEAEISKDNGQILRVSHGK